MQNRYRLTFILFFLLTAFQITFGQEFYIKTAPLGFIDPINPKLQMSFERVSQNDLGLEVEIAHFVNYDLDNLQKDKRGWMFTTEIRKYGPFLPKFKRFLRMSSFRRRGFGGLEIQYLKRDFISPDDFDAISGNFVDVPVTQKFRRLVFKLGKQFQYPSGFMYEYFVGTGISQIREIHFAGDGIINDDGFFSVDRTEAGGRVSGYFEFGLRIGLAMKKVDIFSDY